MHALVITVFLYAYKPWTFTAELQQRIQSLELRCFRKILSISSNDRISNEHSTGGINYLESIWCQNTPKWNCEEWIGSSDEFPTSGFLLRMALTGTMAFIAGTTYPHRITVRHIILVLTVINFTDTQCQ